MPYLLCSSSVLVPGSSIVQEFSTIPQPFEADANISLLTQTGIRSWQEKDVAHGHMAHVRKRIWLALARAEPLSQAQPRPLCMGRAIRKQRLCIWQALNSPSCLWSEQQHCPFSRQGKEGMLQWRNQKCSRRSNGQLASPRLSAKREGSSKGWGRNVPVQKPGSGLHSL